MLNPTAAELTAREIANGNWFILNLAMLITLVWFLWVRRPQPIRWEWTRQPEVAVALAWMVYLVGACVSRGWTYTMLLTRNFERAPGLFVSYYWLATLGAVIGVIGGLCIMRIWTQDAWGQWVWITTGFVALTLPVVVHWAL